MNEICNYLQKHQIEGDYVSDSRGSRFEFKIHDCQIIITYKKDMTIQDFKYEFNKQYLQHIKGKADFHKSMSDIYLNQINQFKSEFN